MAVKLEKTKTMSGDSRYSIKLTVTEKTVTSADIADNSTRVDYKLEATKSSGSGYYSNSAVSTVKVTLDGTTIVNTKKTYDFRNSTPKTITLASGTHTIKHDPDGSKTIACSGYFKDGANSLGNATASGNLTLSQLHTPPEITGYSITETNTALTNIGVSNNQFVGYLSNKRINITYNLDEDTQYQSALVYFEGGSQIAWNNALPITANFASFHPTPVNNYLNLCVSVTDDKNTTSYYSNASGSTQTRQGLDSYAYVPYIIPTFNSSSNAKRDGQLTGKVKLNITGTYYNGEIGSGSSKVNQGGTYKPTIKYKFWKVGESQPSTYAYIIPDSSITTSNGTFSVTNYPIGSADEQVTNYFNPSFSYRVKLYIQDNFKNSESPELSIPVGEAVWTEYKDRVDFKKLTIQNVEVTPGGGGAGDYENLINKPEINGVTLSGDKTASQLGFASVATSGSYNDLSNKPAINNGTLTIQKNGTNVQTFTANQSSNATANITVPTKTSELTNDSGYITTYSNNRRSFYGTCSTAAGTKDKVVTLSDTTGWELKAGTIVGVKFSNTNSYSSTIDNPVTLNVNSTGAKNIWYNTTHSGAGNTGTNTGIYGVANRVYYYMYDGTYWVWLNMGGLDGNTISQLRQENGSVYAGTNGISRYTLIALDNNGAYQSLITTATTGTGTNKTINTSGKFKIDAVIKYYNANNDKTNGNVVSTYALYSAYPTVDTRYSHNHTVTFATNKPLYIECTIDSNGYWSPTTVCITQTLRSGYYYIYLGESYSTEYQLTLTTDHPIYYYNGTNLSSYAHKLASGKQDTLVSGTNIKTINGTSILGSGNISVGGGTTATDVQVNGTSITSGGVANLITQSAYNSSTNKIATKSDIPTSTAQLTNGGSQSGYKYINDIGKHSSYSGSKTLSGVGMFDDTHIYIQIGSLYAKLANYVDLTTSTTGTLTISKTSGSSTCTGTYARNGNVVALDLTLSTSGTINSGADIFVGKITTFTPKVSGELMGYYGARALIAGYGTDQVITVRNAGSSNIGSGNTLNIRGIIIV